MIKYRSLHELYVLNSLNKTNRNYLFYEVNKY